MISRCNLTANAFSTHVLQQHAEWCNQNKNLSLSRMWNGGGGSFGPKAALPPKGYSEMNICVTLALISVYLTAHFKSNADGCLSQTYTSVGVFYFSSFFHMASAYLLAHAFARWTPSAVVGLTYKHFHLQTQRFCRRMIWLTLESKQCSLPTPSVNTFPTFQMWTLVWSQVYFPQCSVLASWQEINCSPVFLAARNLRWLGSRNFRSY